MGIDRPNSAATLWLAVAEIRATGGDAAGSEAAKAAALGLYELKGNVAAAARVREAAD